MRTVEPSQTELSGSQQGQEVQAVQGGSQAHAGSSAAASMNETPATSTQPTSSSDAQASTTTTTAERVIDEHTDLSTLTDQEIIRLTQNIKESSDAVKRVSSWLGR